MFFSTSSAEKAVKRAAVRDPGQPVAFGLGARALELGVQHRNLLRQGLDLGDVAGFLLAHRLAHVVDFQQERLLEPLDVVQVGDILDALALLEDVVVVVAVIGVHGHHRPGQDVDDLFKLRFTLAQVVLLPLGERC